MDFHNEEGGMSGAGGDLANVPLISGIQLKGGAGKTTLVSMLALAAVQGGLRVLFLDGDDNEDSSEYLRELDEPNLFDENVTEGGVKKAMRKHGGKVDIIFADSAGGGSTLFSTFMNLSDINLVPVALSKNDVKQALRTIELMYDNSVEKGDTSIFETYRAVWVNTPTRGWTKKEKSHFAKFRDNNARMLDCHFRSHSVIDTFTDEFVNPYRFLEDPEQYIGNLVDDDEDLTEGQIRERVRSTVEKTEKLILNVNALYKSVLNELQKVGGN